MKKILVITFSSLLSLMSYLTHAGNKNMNIEEVLSTYEQALNASDTSQIMQLYSKSPVFMPQHAPAQEGRTAIEGAYNYVFSNIKLNVKFTTYEIEVLGDTAWARTSSAGKTKVLANNAIIEEGNNELFVFKMENGEWKIHRYLFATTTPAK
ncbi:YybH family protein [Paraglaciecola sp.]|uniref:YybH family protein n=1 Tax=Paraglaciecola sp. TaxID=1920173 RepID=UPI003EF786B8